MECTKFVSYVLALCRGATLDVGRNMPPRLTWKSSLAGSVRILHALSCDRGEGRVSLAVMDAFPIGGAATMNPVPTIRPLSTLG